MEGQRDVASGITMQIARVTIWDIGLSNPFTKSPLTLQVTIRDWECAGRASTLGFGVYHRAEDLRAMQIASKPHSPPAAEAA